MRLKDGRYQGLGSSRHGDIVADVVIQKGQIVYAGIAECLTRYSCSVIKQLPEQVVVRQSIEVDLVSGASESTSAFQDGIAAALARAQARRYREPMNETVYRRTEPLMGTLVTIDVVGALATAASAQLEEAVERAFGWFQQIEECCTRFDPQSELARLSAHSRRRGSRERDPL